MAKKVNWTLRTIDQIADMIVGGSDNVAFENSNVYVIEDRELLPFPASAALYSHKYCATLGELWALFRGFTQDELERVEERIGCKIFNIFPHCWGEMNLN